MEAGPNTVPDATYSQWFDSIIDYGQERNVGGTDGDQQLYMQERAEANSQPGTTKKSKGRRHLSKGSKQALQKWFMSNIQHPYPSEVEKQSLSKETGLSVRQVADWFANTRRRRKYKTETPSPLIQAKPQSITPSPIPVPLAPMAWESMSPLDRWRHSPPDQEPAPLTAITDAVLNVGTNTQNHIPQDWSFFDSSDSSVGTSVGSFGSSISGRLSHSPSIVGSGSESSGPLKNSRRRRRRYRPNSPTKTSRKRRGATEDRIYQCTFCTDTFKSKYDWTRHESTLHLTLEAWVCHGHQGVYIDDKGRKCIFCDVLDPSDSHLEQHNFDKCAKKPESARTFYRKDHLTQHLRSVHNSKRVTTGMAEWKSKLDQINCRCGFCGERFLLWSQRNAHIAEHFTDGVKIKDWKGCRGLDPSISLLVENAMPPYLIGMEAGSFEPFRASQGGRARSDHESSDQEIPPPSGTNCFEELTAQLSEYIMAARATGTNINDEDIRREARIITYGDDDPWNQTAADNPQWLEYFKQGHGIPSGDGALDLSTQSDFDLCNFTADLDPSFGALFGFSQTATGYGNLPLNWRTPECLAEITRWRNLTQCNSSYECQDPESGLP
ncbi:hypothetical protein AOL_s00097g65 [Orbilia oligospora ATCC 24927]|uniref:Homeobox and C2H2 transcription factor n=1 Tax=Arthrobotrys oligospora (strain ATCC 24927 / CBS 115.81 / DSM 1491) TaxID=756982 RepID=G1XI88_ARTOA|nr:hypothetical protein AOL_s00097g65 [Orbilia oligospora ATCC 24927]EGX47019.1 hypothetical protein AOL_s00097g65 [Orbilia oligospora ATCC 24927]